VAVARGDGPSGGAGPGVDGAVTAVAEPAHTHMPTKLGIIPRDGDDKIDVNGFSFGFVGDRVGHMSGFQMGLGWTEAQSGLHGMQLAIGATYVRGDARGLQLADFITASEGRFSGAQIAGLGALATDVRGLQLAGIAAYTRGAASGLQMAGVATVAQTERGLQLAGVANVADNVRGLQLAGVVNFARDQAGMQLGVVNVVDDGGGLRFGVVNVARKTRGFQFGVVNVAKEDDGESFAVVNVIGNGIHNVAVYATDVFLTNLSLKLGGRHLYTSLGAGYQPGTEVADGTMLLTRGTARWGATFGVGWRLAMPVAWLESLEIEASGANVFPAWHVNGTPPQANALRVTGIIRVMPHLSVLAGVAWNVMVGQEGHDLDLSLGGGQSVIHDGQTTVRMYPGFILGVQI
jgi:hypothetical protein